MGLGQTEATTVCILFQPPGEEKKIVRWGEGYIWHARIDKKYVKSIILSWREQREHRRPII